MPVPFKENVNGRRIDTAITAERPGIAPQRIPKKVPTSIKNSADGVKTAAAACKNMFILQILLYEKSSPMGRGTRRARPNTR